MKIVYEWALTLESGVEIVGPELAKLAPWRSDAVDLYLVCNTFDQGFLVSRHLTFPNTQDFTRSPLPFQLEWAESLPFSKEKKK